MTDLAELTRLFEAERGDDLYVRWSRGPERSLRLWLARRLYVYEHLRDLRGPGVQPWVLRGREIARGPDNEPLVVAVEPLAWVADEQGSREWGPMDRRGAR
ncbi:DUF6098 family protein [Amycolatopsis sp. DG1A-15b]|uniref:DUF6098 family protein n=1 Tax=Amycolatopsis sp. DG1A-15b TaxID=3052846 RepID=UPI00255BAD11|nr:DUF6098 family protein [Amycolatopsis sp. DG1A-15b]WIX90069.1 DUF6098 family protein [Amycolatopsis sp. DG1A-15b]